MKTLKDIHLNFDTDKGTQHSYIEIYDFFLESYKNKKVIFLEIGCLTCGSLKMFNSYFENSTIYGIDDWSQTTDVYGVPLVTPTSVMIEDINKNYPNIKLITCDSRNKQQVDAMITEQFDIIIDDGDHSFYSQIETMINFLPKLKPDGIYFIEDVYGLEGVPQQIENALKANFPNRTFKYFSFMKNGKGDDNIVIIK